MRAVCFSYDRYRVIIGGLLAGTCGFDRRGSAIAISACLRNGKDHMQMAVGSRKVNLRRRSVTGLFAHFCRNGRDFRNGKVNLSCTGRLMRVRKNVVKTRGGRAGKTAFFFALPCERRTTSVRSAPRACLGSTLRLSTSVSCGRPRRSGVRGFRSVLVIRSSHSLYGCLVYGLRILFRRICRTRSNVRTLPVLASRHPRVMLDSIGVPHVGKFRLYHCVGRGPSLGCVPIVLLASYISSTDVRRKCGAKTRTCVAGPFSVSLLSVRVRGVVRGRGVIGGRCTAVSVPVPGRRGLGRVGRRLVLRFDHVIGRGVDGISVSIGFVTGRVKVDHTSLCGGAGKVVSVNVDRCVVGYHLRCTHGLLSTAALSVDRMTRRSKFGRSHGFDAMFGGTVKVDPSSCEGGSSQPS